MRSLIWRLSLAFLVVSVTGALVAAVFVWLATQNAFQHDASAHAEAQFITQLTGYYQYHHSWAGVVEYVRGPQSPASPPPGGGQAAPNTPPPFVLADQQRRVILAGRTYTPGQVLTPAQYASGTPIKVDGATVGVVLTDGAPPLSAADTQFLAAIERALILGALTAILVALGLGVVLARSLTRPLRELTVALHALGDGGAPRVAPVRSRDELGELAAAFNTMSANLAQANGQRRQMTANIAHDLRTPITVMAGYLEALRDGVLAPTPERFAVMYEEAQRLQSLVTHGANRGYGAALASGFAAATKDRTLFMDADGQFTIRDVARLLILADGYDAVLGYRQHRQDSPLRLLNAWGWRLLVGLALGVRVRDLDCAFKLIRTDVLHRFPPTTLSALVNAELVYTLNRVGATYCQVGVRHLPRQGGRATGANPRVIARALWDLATQTRHWRRRSYTAPNAG